MNNLETLKDKKWIVAVSGGADSMSLLDMCYKANLDLIVAHVNYQKRDTANRDMNGVQIYCTKRNIPCFVLCVEKYKSNVNFQAQARDIRYKFFKRLLDENAADGVLVAHQLDDVIETYFMQRESHRTPAYFGIKEETHIFGMLVKRVLLGYTKEELRSYCYQHKIEFFDDESNSENHYRRNQIRHQKIEYMTRNEKEKVYEEINKLNYDKLLKETRVNLILKGMNKKIVREEFLNIDEDDRKAVLRKWIENNCEVYSMSEKHLNELYEMIIYKNNNFKHNINDIYYLCCEYGLISIEKEEELSYHYTLYDVKELDTPYFKITSKGKTIERLSLNEGDFPIVIRNAKQGDCITLRMGTKKVSRFFIDRKIPTNERKTWPVIENKYGKVIFVCGIGCDIEHFSNNYLMFVLKC